MLLKLLMVVIRMDGTGIEPVTFSVSGRRATAAPTVRAGGILSRPYAFVKTQIKNVALDQSPARNAPLV